jgi:uncharacterized protein (DUF362 family)
MAKVVLASAGIKDFSDKDISDAVGRAIDSLNFNFNGNFQNVVIKPNLCYYWDCSTGETTDPRVVSAMIDYVRYKVGDDVNISIAEADASSMKTRYSFKVLEYDKLGRAKKVDLVNLSEGEITDVKVKVREKEFTLPINDLLLKADLIINMPKLKTHSLMGVTCSLKNMFGAISKPRKYSYHSMLPYVIVGMNKIVKSHIILVDGITVKGSYPKKLGVVMAGDNPLATDFIAAKIMGWNPKSMQYLKMAEQEQIGQTKDVALIEEGIKLAQIKSSFPSYNHFMHRLSWSLQLRMLRLYAKVTGDVLPPVLET